MSESLTKESKPRKARIREDREARILENAEEVFAEKGFQGATTGLIAEKAGVSKASLHYYFPTKEDLYRQIITDICDQWLSSAGTFEDEKDPAIALSRYLEAKIDLSRSRPNASKVWANELVHGAKFTQSYLITRVKPWFDERISIIEGWIDEGLIDPIDPATLLYMIWGSTQTFSDFEAQIIVLNGDKPLSDEQFEKTKQTVIHIFLKGLGIKL